MPSATLPTRIPTISFNRAPNGPQTPRRPLSLAMLPSKIACNALSKATSLYERVQGGLRSLSCQRDKLLDDNVSSTSLDPQHAPPSSTCAHTFAASAADSSSLQRVKNASSTEHVSAVTLAVDSGSTWHLHHRRDQLTNLRPCNDYIKGTRGVSQRCLAMADLEISSLDENGRETTMKLADVRLASDVDIALISVSQLIDANYEVMLGCPPRQRDPSGATLPLHMSNGLYLLKGHKAQSPSHKQAAKINVTHAAAFGNARDPHTTLHIATLSLEEAARHMCRRLHLGMGKMRALPTVTADVPSNLGKTGASASAYMTTTNATKRSHTESRY